MANQYTTLRDVLTQTKPDIPYTGPPRKSTRGPWPKFKNSATIWTDFTLTNLNESYGQILDFPIRGGLQLPPAPSDVLAGVSVKEVTDIRHLTCWNNQIIQPTVDFAKRHLGIEAGVGLLHTATTVDNNVRARLPLLKPPAVDHTVMLDDFQSLVVGIGRATEWSARNLTSQLPNTGSEIFWPVRQIAQVCRVAKTRYGYVQTPNDLLVCRFSAENGPDDDNWKVAIQSIPWARKGREAFTTDLALWWLCMLAISGEHHRAITGEEDMVSIAARDTVYLDEERGWARRHQYSNIEVPTNPPLPPAYQIPSPGNPAAFEAEVGLNARDDFNIEEFVENDLVPVVDNNLNGAEYDFNLDFDFDFDYNMDDANLFLERNAADLG